VIIYFTDKFAGGRNESRSLLKRAIAVHTGDDGQAETLIGALKKGEHGKPYIEGFSCFSISHTGSIWAVLIADPQYENSGLDIQLSRKCNYMAIAERWFAPEDRASISSADEFFRIWTRREALVKALGVTVYDADLKAVSGNHLTVDGKEYTISDISIPEVPGLYAAICFCKNCNEKHG
jgi:phosphopantetheinyl transferase